LARWALFKEGNAQRGVAQGAGQRQTSQSAADDDEIKLHEL
jgi:hypothetical protein